MKESKFQFTKPVLESVVFKVNNENEVDDEKSVIQINHQISLKVEKNIDNDNEAQVFMNVKLGSFINENGEIDKDKFPFYIEVEMKAEFNTEGIEDKESIDSLLKANAPVLLLSFIRPVIHIITGMSKFPPYDIPFLDFSEDNN